MAKIVLDNILSGYDLSKINVNFQRIATQINNNILFRQVAPGETNSLLQDLDANGKHIYNLPDPTLEGDAVPYGWLLEQDELAAASAIAAAESAAAALISEQNAAASASIIAGWEYKETWTPSTAYVKNNIVNIASGTYQGWSFTALEDHTSNATFDTDYLAGKWGILVQRGATGPGSGDMLAANNLSDVTDKDVSRQNIDAAYDLDIGSYINTKSYGSGYSFVAADYGYLLVPNAGAAGSWTASLFIPANGTTPGRKIGITARVDAPVTVSIAALSSIVADGASVNSILIRGGETYEFVLLSTDGTNASWLALKTSVRSAGASGGGTDSIFWENGQTVNSNYTIAANTNAGSFGPTITIGTGVTVEIGTNAFWTIV